MWWKKEQPRKPSIPPPLDEKTLSLVERVRARVEQCGALSSGGPELQEDIQQLTQTETGIEALAAIFVRTFQTPRLNGAVFTMGARLVAVGRKDALLAVIRQSRRSTEYWSGVLTIASILASSGEPDGIELVLQFLKKNWNVGFSGEIVRSILKKSLEKSASKVSDATLKSMLRLPPQLAAEDLAPEDDSSYDISIDIRDILQLAHNEVSRRASSAR